MALEVRADAAEEERLRILADLSVSGTDREERFDRVTRLAEQLFGAERVAVTLVDRDVQWIKSEWGFDGARELPCRPRSATSRSRSRE